MMTFKKYCEENNLDQNKALEIVVSSDEGVLATRGAFTGYFAEITDTSMICTNDKLGIRKELPFADFNAAEFAISNGYLWIKCVVNGKFFAFNTTRKAWGAPAGKLLIQKISEKITIENMKHHEHYMGKWFFIYMWK